MLLFAITWQPEPQSSTTWNTAVKSVPRHFTNTSDIQVRGLTTYPGSLTCWHFLWLHATSRSFLVTVTEQTRDLEPHPSNSAVLCDDWSAYDALMLRKTFCPKHPLHRKRLCSYEELFLGIAPIQKRLFWIVTVWTVSHPYWASPHTKVQSSDSLWVGHQNTKRAQMRTECVPLSWSRAPPYHVLWKKNALMEVR